MQKEKNVLSGDYTPAVKVIATHNVADRINELVIRHRWQVFSPACDSNPTYCNSTETISAIGDTHSATSQSDPDIIFAVDADTAQAHTQQCPLLVISSDIKTAQADSKCRNSELFVSGVVVSAVLKSIHNINNPDDHHLGGIDIEEFYFSQTVYFDHELKRLEQQLISNTARLSCIDELIEKILLSIDLTEIFDKSHLIKKSPKGVRTENSHSTARKMASAGNVRASNTSVPDRILQSASEFGDSAAITCGSVQFTYAEMVSEIERMSILLNAKGFGSGSRIGVMLGRSAYLPIVLVAIMNAGAAYVPIDPDYPHSRIAMVLDDAQLHALFVDEHHTMPPCSSVLPLFSVGLSDTKKLVVTEHGEFQNNLSPNTQHCATPKDLAYIIFTSGSTGRPKGVMVEHRNALNFFDGMNEAVPVGERRRFLALTSVSFDISILELLWTLSRGFEVVIGSQPSAHSTPHVVAAPHHPDKNSLKNKFNLGLYFFGEESEYRQSQKYAHIIRGAQFADRNDFSAVWTPERHFHSFGGLFPNPSVLSAALATATDKIGIRAGSCVLPLHHPARVAEEWSVVDNLSNGRAGVSFATGWQPDDFVLQPERFQNRHARLLEDIETVRGLWRGESRSFEGPEGSVELTTLPRPVQNELPVWLTAAGNPETFRLAGQSGANLLTHLLGQSLDELAEKISIYRHARADSGHPDNGIVSLMAHTFIHESAESALSLSREPLKQYLGTSANLVKNYASAFPIFKHYNQNTDLNAAFKNLSNEDMDELLNHAFERFYTSSALIGDMQQAENFLERVLNIGVNEVACLIDFGIHPETVSAQLPNLAKLRNRVWSKLAEQPEQAKSQRTAQPIDSTASVFLPVHELIERYDISHLQCTPSMATLLAADADAHPALERLDSFLVGGEALPNQLAEKLQSLVGGQLVSMYGPTETTIWSACNQTPTIKPADVTSATLGNPITRTQLTVINESGLPVADGETGELAIGGAGVARGYYNNEALTKQRFIENPNPADNDLPGWEKRLYRTGDLVCRRDGHLVFLGRADDQVKIRGHRVETGDVEHALNQQEGIIKAVVLATTNEQQQVSLVAYVLSHQAYDESVLKHKLSQLLPAYMLPHRIVNVDAFPQTPNGKTDRRALRQLVQAMAERDHPKAAGRLSEDPPIVAPKKTTTPAWTHAELIEAVSSIWKDLLNVADIDINRNFFDAGGTSLLVIGILQQLRERIDPSIKLVDLFQYPTVASLVEKLQAKHLPLASRQASGSLPADAQPERTEPRRDALAERAQRRAQARRGARRVRS